jgi:hypothetical protein
MSKSKAVGRRTATMRPPLTELIHEHLRARLAELEDQVTLGIAPPGADEEIGIIREIFVALGTPCQPRLAALDWGDRGQDWGSA